MERMIGKQIHTGPGGRSCSCCNEPPGKKRRKQRRTGKKSERSRYLRFESNAN